MALSNKERQERWLKKNRALHNLRRRKRRDAESTVCTGVPERENDRPTVPDAVGEIPTPATNLPVPVLAEPQQIVETIPDEQQGSGEAREAPIGARGGQNLSKIEELRELVRVEQEKPHVEHPAKPLVYRSDTGQPITKERWEKRQEEKRKAKEKGFEIDEYSQ